MNEDDQTPQKEPWRPDWIAIVIAIVIIMAMISISQSQEADYGPSGDINGRDTMAGIVRLV